jgi:hypothetical protein
VIAGPVAIAVAYHQFLGQRSDYLGHYLAGCGGTLLLLVVTLAILPPAQYARLAPASIVLLALVAIAIGAMFESTIYRIAKFDEVDFCNQSLGAVIAGLGVMLMAWRAEAACGRVAVHGLHRLRLLGSGVPLCVSLSAWRAPCCCWLAHYWSRAICG